MANIFDNPEEFKNISGEDWFELIRLLGTLTADLQTAVTNGFPIGGQAGDVLTKLSSADFDADWLPQNSQNAIDLLQLNAVGSIVFAQADSGIYSMGEIINGAFLNLAGVDIANAIQLAPASALTGSWQCLGFSSNTGTTAWQKTSEDAPPAPPSAADLILTTDGAYYEPHVPGDSFDLNWFIDLEMTTKVATDGEFIKGWRDSGPNNIPLLAETGTGNGSSGFKYSQGVPSADSSLSWHMRRGAAKFGAHLPTTIGVRIFTNEPNGRSIFGILRSSNTLGLEINNGFNDGGLDISYSNMAGSSANQVASSVNYFGAWHTFILTHTNDGPPAQIKVYVDGLLVSTFNDAQQSALDEDLQFSIGARAVYLNAGVLNTIDSGISAEFTHIFFDRRVLSGSEISQLHAFMSG